MSLTITLILNLLNSISILFLLALGLYVIFGLMGIVNLAHGEFIMLGAYTAVITSKIGLSPWFGLFFAPIVLALISFIVERVLIRHLYGKVMESILATWGLAIIIRQLVEWIFGKGYQPVSTPINGIVSVMDTNYPLYRLLVILVALAIGIVFLITEHRTNLGHTVKAVIDNPTLASSLGVNIDRVYQITFVVGGALAGLAGAIIAPFVNVYPGMGLGFVINAFLAVLVGGMGSIVGLMGSSSLLGGTDSIISFALDPIWGSICVVVISILFMRFRRAV